jgi:hypothetical protein
MIASAGVTVGEKLGWFGSLRWRFVGPHPLTEDNYFRSPPLDLVNAYADTSVEILTMVSRDLVQRPERYPAAVPAAE